MKRGLSTIMAMLALTTTVIWAAPPASAAKSSAPLPSKVSPPATKYVDVSVATSWVTPGTNRPGIDDAAIANPANPRLWVSSMTLKEKLGLNSLVETQSLYGTRVTIDEQVVVNGLLWVHAWVDGQPTPRDINHYGGYPGWIPDQQLTAQPPPAPAGGTARVTGSASGPGHSAKGGVTAWAYDSAQTAAARGTTGRLIELSFGTTLALAHAEPGLGRSTQQPRRPPVPQRRRCEPEHLAGERSTAHHHGSALPPTGVPVGRHLRIRIRLLGLHPRAVRLHRRGDLPRR